MKIYNLFIGVVLGTFLLVETSHADPFCVELFKKQEVSTPHILVEDGQALHVFEMSLGKLQVAPSMRRANEAMDSLMAQANILIDHVVLNILSVHLNRLSPFETTVYMGSSEAIVNYLSERLQIPIQSLERAVAIRINDQLRLDQIQAQADQERSTSLGFGERAVVTNDSPNRFAIGFETVRQTREPKSETVEKIPMGFDLGHDRTPSAPQESLRKKTAASGAVEKGPVGYKNFPGKDLEHSLVLNNKTGYFVIRFEQQQPMGFILRQQK